MYNDVYKIVLCQSLGNFSLLEDYLKEHPWSYTIFDNNPISSQEEEKEGESESASIPLEDFKPKVLLLSNIPEVIMKILGESKKDVLKKLCGIHTSYNEVNLTSRKMKSAFRIVTEKNLTPKPESKQKYILIKPL